MSLLQPKIDQYVRGRNLHFAQHIVIHGSQLHDVVLCETNSSPFSDVKFFLFFLGLNLDVLVVFKIYCIVNWLC